MEKLLSRLHQKKVTQHLEDSVTKTKSGKFSIKSFHDALEPSGTALFPICIICSPCVSLKAFFSPFCIGRAYSMALTLDQVKRRG